MHRQLRLNAKRNVAKGRARLKRFDDDDDDDFEDLDTTSFFGLYAPAIILSYLAVGAAFYSFAENWHISDALYFSVVTLTTVGYGDMAPSSDFSKLFTIFYILIGLSLVATSLGLLIGRVQARVEAAHTHEVNKLGLMFKMFAIIIVTMFTGAAIVMKLEGWSLLDSVYWAVVTATSVGYGDVVSQQPVTRVFSTAYMLFSVGCFAAALSRFGSMIMEVEAEHKVNDFIRRGVSEGMVEQMDKDKNGAIDRAEFLQYMLVRMGKVTQDDLDKINSMFNAFDVDGSGAIDMADVRRQKQERSSRREQSAGSEGANEPMGGSAGAEFGLAEEGNGGKSLARPLLTGELVDTAIRDEAWGIAPKARDWWPS